MRKLIETYKGIEIYFDTSQSKFDCSISDTEEKQSKSYDAVKKHIDDYRNNNQEFDPFIVVHAPYAELSAYTNNTVLINGLRKDRRFTYEGKNKITEQLSGYDEPWYMLEKPSNNSIIAKMNKNYNDYVDAREHHKRIHRELFDMLEITTLVDFKNELFSKTDI